VIGQAEVGRRAAALAVAIGLIAIGAVVCLVLFYVVGGPLGAINDVGNALIGILSAFLAVELRGVARTGWLAIAATVVGAALTVIGSALVMSGTTGFFLAGLVSSVGFALIGSWLVALNRSTTLAGRLRGSVRSLGLVAGAAMVAGIVAVPGIGMGIDDMNAVPPWLWIFGIGWLGTYLLYPIWCLFMGLSEI
jgi:hypothetical protein